MGGLLPNVPALDDKPKENGQLETGDQVTNISVKVRPVNFPSFEFLNFSIYSACLVVKILLRIGKLRKFLCALTRIESMLQWNNSLIVKSLDLADKQLPLIGNFHFSLSVDA